MENFKTTPGMNDNLNKLAEFLDSKINIMNNLQNDYKENSIEYFLCDNCEDYIHGSKLQWQNDTAICPNCNSKINL